MAEPKTTAAKPSPKKPTASRRKRRVQSAKRRPSLWHPDEKPKRCGRCKSTERSVETSREFAGPERRVRYCTCRGCGGRFCTVQVTEEAYK